MARRSPLDDPDNAQFAWGRFKRLMRFMIGVTALVVAAVLTFLHTQVSEVSPHFYIAVGLGVAVSMMLMAALMGLVFMSSGTGHDEAVDNSLDSLDSQDDGDKR